MKDLIDFPCSDTWLGYYHERGLTPRKPAREDKQVLSELRKLRESIELNNKIMKALWREIHSQNKNIPNKKEYNKSQRTNLNLLER